MTNEARKAWIRTRLEQTLQPTLLVITDDSHKHKGHVEAKGAGHFTVEISSPSFLNRTLVDCHRLVYDALAQAIPDEIHALKIVIKR